jgi:U32 family peptidase
MDPIPSIHAPELLAPAGGPDALRAAVRNGADAVYLGLETLNARRGAANFTLETLPEACRFAHLRGARVYLTANVVVLETEMRDALRMVARAWESGIDAVIVQDLGLLAAIHASLPEVRIHASTQIDAHNTASIQALAMLGVTRVTLARELSVREIAGLVAGSPVELESFVHGSLCFCHSGQCLMSSMVGGRSANRGMCAQPCRLPYELVGPDGRVAETPGRYLLSPKDLAGVAVLPALVRAGVAALKIEGRMKSPEYVASVVSVYRAALDRAVARPDSYGVEPAEEERLEEAFNRGFTEGYLAEIRDDRMMSYGRPNNRGVPIGRVAGWREGRATISLERALESADTIEFWTGAGRFAQTAGRMVVGEREVSAAPARSKASILTEEPVREGDRVFRVANAALMEAARRTYQGSEERHPVDVDFTVRLRTGEPARVSAAALGHEVAVEGPVVELARTKALVPAEVIEHIGRMGGTAYSLGDTHIELDAGAGIGFSVLHRLRREALDALDEERLKPWAWRSPPEDPAPPRLTARVHRPGAVALVVAVADSEAASACLAAGADRVLQYVAAAGDAPLEGVDSLLPRVAHEDEVAALLETAGTRPAAGNLGLLAALGARGVAADADWGLNVTNPWAAGALGTLGAGFVWASPELSGRQIAALVGGSPLPVGVVVGGRTELMVAEHCIVSAAGPCSGACSKCARSSGWMLRDRKDYEFPVRTDAAGRAHVYNSVPLDLSRALGDIVGSGVAAIRLDLQTETAKDAAGLTRAWRQRLDAALAGAPPAEEPVVRPSTSGHFFRGVA